MTHNNINIKTINFLINHVNFDKFVQMLQKLARCKLKLELLDTLGNLIKLLQDEKRRFEVLTYLHCLFSRIWQKTNLTKNAEKLGISIQFLF